MERVVKKSHSFEDADRWDVEQQNSMTAEERQQVARELRDRAYGKDAPDIRESTKDKLLENKKASGRDKDLDDLRYLGR